MTKEEKPLFISNGLVEKLAAGMVMDKAVHEEIFTGALVIRRCSTDPKDALEVVKAMAKYCCCFDISMDLEGAQFDISYVLRNPDTHEYRPEGHVPTKFAYAFDDFCEGVCKTALIAVFDFKKTFEKESKK